MKTSIKNSIDKAFKLSKSERIQRLIELGIKEQDHALSFDEMLEMSAIQAIRMENGEIDAVLKSRGIEHTPNMSDEQ